MSESTSRNAACAPYCYARIYAIAMTPCLDAGFVQEERSTITLIVDQIPAVLTEKPPRITMINPMSGNSSWDLTGELLGTNGALWIELVISGERSGISQITKLTRMGSAMTIAAIAPDTVAPFNLSQFPLP